MLAQNRAQFVYGTFQCNWMRRPKRERKTNEPGRLKTMPHMRMHKPKNKVAHDRGATVTCGSCQNIVSLAVRAVCIFDATAIVCNVDARGRTVLE